MGTTRVNKKREEQSRRCWDHNGLYGSACMMQVKLQKIAASNTCTEDAKQLARDMVNASIKLQELLCTRVDYKNGCPEDGLILAHMTYLDGRHDTTTSHK